MSDMTEAQALQALSPWATLGQRWGHPWHAMCSYLGTFPAALARSMVSMLSEPGDVVLDPFSGRGTTLLESRLLGRMSLAIDLNPIAVALSWAKNVTLTSDIAHARVQELREGYDKLLCLPEAQVQGDDIQLIFHPATLGQLCYLRRKLLTSCSPVDRFLLGAVLGVMHGSERQDGSSGYASISMPNTFSMSPNYVRRFVETNRLNRVARDVFEILGDKVDRLFREPPPTGPEGLVVAGDAKQLTKIPELHPYRGKVKLVVTSPPYLDLVNYAKQNWIRNWLLAPHPDSDLAGDLDDNLTLKDWLDFIESVMLEIKQLLRPDGVFVMVVGDVAKANRSHISLAREFIQRIQHDGIFSYVGCFEDYIGQDIKTTRIWKDTKGRATEIDRVIVLSDVRPTFQVISLPAALGFTNLTSGQLGKIDADVLVANAKAFCGVTASLREVERSTANSYSTPSPEEMTAETVPVKRSPVKTGSAKSAAVKPSSTDRTSTGSKSTMKTRFKAKVKKKAATKRCSTPGKPKASTRRKNGPTARDK